MTPEQMHTQHVYNSMFGGQFLAITGRHPVGKKVGDVGLAQPRLSQFFFQKLRGTAEILKKVAACV